MASQLPIAIPAFTVPFPILIPEIPMVRPEYSEMTFRFSKADERGYPASPPIGGTETMYAAEYSFDSGDFGVLNHAVIINERSGLADEMVKAAFLALAQEWCLRTAYENQSPPLPVPDNPGWSLPLYKEAMETVDGTMRLRGFCSGLRSLEPARVATVDVYVEPVHFIPGPPE